MFSLGTLKCKSNIVKGTINGPSVIKKNNTAQFNIVPESGYEYPDSVSIDGAKLDSYDKNKYITQINI